MNTGLSGLGPSINGRGNLGAQKTRIDQSLKDDGGFQRVLTGQKDMKERLSKSSPRVPQLNVDKERSRLQTTKNETTVKAKTWDKSDSRQSKMKQFMDSFESELGISPREVVGAMAELSDKELSQPPEATASQVVKNLADKFQLSKKDQEKAMELYLTLLQQTQGLPKESPSSQMGLLALGASSQDAISDLGSSSLTDSFSYSGSPELAEMSLRRGFGGSPSSAGLSPYAAGVNDQRNPYSDSESSGFARISEKQFGLGQITPEIDSSQDRSSQSNVNADGDNVIFEDGQGDGFNEEASSTSTDENLLQKKRESSNSSLENQSQALRDRLNRQQFQGNLEENRLGQEASAGGFKGALVREASSLNATKQGQNPSVDGNINKILSNENSTQNLKDLMQSIDPQSPEAKMLAERLRDLSDRAQSIKNSLLNQFENKQALQIEAQMNQSGSFGAFGDSEDEDSTSSSDSFFGNSSMESLKTMSQNERNADVFKDALKTQNGSSIAQSANESTTKGMTAQQEALNSQRLMNQAQILLKKGGGEAKILMAPEGIGQVHMKMTLLDGKVNLEMQAENPETKKLIESSLSELKTKLNHHQLSIENIKVDNLMTHASQQSSLDSQSDSSKNRQFDQQQGFNREQTRNFWNQFDGGESSRRSQFNESSGIRAYGGSRRPSPMVGEDLTPQNAVQRFMGSGKGRGLNLVA